MNTYNRFEIEELLLGLIENNITDQQLERLESWLARSPSALETYCEIVKNYGAIQVKYNSELNLSGRSDARDEFEQEFLLELVDHEKQSPAIVREEVPGDMDGKQTGGRTQAASSAEWQANLHKMRFGRKELLRGFLQIAAVVLFAIGIILFDRHINRLSSTPKVVAELSETMNVRWSPDSPMPDKDRLLRRGSMGLEEGFAKLRMKNGADVIIEGPARFELITPSEIELTYGRLFAHVSEVAKGFTVTTENAKIIDLGTEFGVLGNLDGTAEFHVYEGKTTLLAGSQEDRKTTVDLEEGQATYVDRRHSRPQSIALRRDYFAQGLNPESSFIWRGQKTIDLADIVGGGNGFGTGMIDRGIDVETGRYTIMRTEPVCKQGSKGFVPVPDNGFIDGVFVPGVGEGDTQIVSSGMTTGAFPTTTGFYWGYIFNGAWHEGYMVERHTLQLDGEAIGTHKHPALALHANLGITFDLHELRQKLRGLTFTAFEAEIGISETVNRHKDLFTNAGIQPDSYRKACFWVFVDGKMVSSRVMSSGEGGYEIETLLQPGSRYLTLAVTEADDSWMFDWAVFAEPRLRIERMTNDE